MDTDRRSGANTQTIHTHRPVNYRFAVIASNDVLAGYSNATAYLERWWLLAGPPTATRRPTRSLTSNLLRKTKVSIHITVDKARRNGAKVKIDLCRMAFKDSNPKVADHCHLSRRFRRTVYNVFNLKVKTTNFVPCFCTTLRVTPRTLSSLNWGMTTGGFWSYRILRKGIFRLRVTNYFSIRFVPVYGFVPVHISR